MMCVLQLRVIDCCVLEHVVFFHNSSSSERTGLQQEIKKKKKPSQEFSEFSGPTMTSIVHICTCTQFDGPFDFYHDRGGIKEYI